MYLTQTERYCRGTEQAIRRAPFLIVVVCYDRSDGSLMGKRLPLRGLVRKVALHQTGHFMMGSARVHGKRICISGCYGSDGLPREVDQETYDRATPMPAELEAAFWQGGGHNSCGSEADALLAWGQSLMASRHGNCY